MRSTIHLLTAEDALALRPTVQVVVERSTLGAFGRRLAGVDPEALATAAREIVDGRPRTASELGRLLAGRFPGSDPEALAQGARAWLPMVQVPPRGIWGRSGRALQAPLDSWLGAPLAATSLPTLVRRYLAAFGPATVRDIQTWCGLTRLAEIVDGLRPELGTLTGPDGRELLDLPDAPRPDPDTPAPPRFLYDFDNLLLSHADRSRMLPDPAGFAAQGYTADAMVQPSSLLVDGVVAGTWTVARAGDGAVLTVRGFRPFPPAERDAISEEGAALLAFLHPGRSGTVEV
jgi:hypothetical protein